MSEKTEKWLCSGCQFLLGYVENKTIIRIKRKDLYVQVTGGQVMLNCCRCGKLNHLIDEPDLIHLSESKGKEEIKNGV